MSDHGSTNTERRGVIFGAIGITALGAGSVAAASVATSDEPSLRYAFTLQTPTKPMIVISNAPRKRSVIPLDGGTVSGRINGKVVLGSSWLETRDDGNIEYLVRYLIEAENGQIIADQATGFIRMADHSGALYTKTFHHFEAPEGDYSWLNKSAFVGHVVRVEGGRHIRVYEIV